MKRVKNKGSEIEILLQKELWSRALRYRKNVKGITDDDMREINAIDSTVENT